MPTRKEKYQAVFDKCVSDFKSERPDITDVAATCLVPGMRPVWVAWGVMHCMWGNEMVAVFGVKDKFSICEPEEAWNASQQMQAVFKWVKDGPYATGNKPGA